MFNRFYSPDIDIDKMEVTSGFVFSNPSDISMPIRWYHAQWQVTL